MDGATAKRSSVAGTLGVGLVIGRALREAHERHLDPFAHLIATLDGTSYAPARVIFVGKIVEVFRRTAEGFANGTVRIQELNGEIKGKSRPLSIDFQNENLIARVRDEVLAVVPNLICILEIETAEPITTEELRYGQREIMRTPEALEVSGPWHFGFDHDFIPIEAPGR